MSPARCVIPAAGAGTRLRPVTSTVPKPLLPIGTRPMIQWCLTEALEAGFDEIAVVLAPDATFLEAYLREGRWREGILGSLSERAAAIEPSILRQERPTGVVDAVLSARSWIEARGTLAVFLPDNVRIAGRPPITAAHLAEAEASGDPLVACHRVGPEARHFFGNVGRAELEALVPAGERPRVTALQARGQGSFRAPPEGAWRLAPRIVVTAGWLEVARGVAAEAAVSGTESDDVLVHRRLVQEGRLRAVTWEGTLVDAGRPAGYLYAHHLLHEALARERDREDEGPGLVQVELERSDSGH